MCLTPFLLLGKRVSYGGMLSIHVESKSQVSTDHKLSGLNTKKIFSSNEILHLFFLEFLSVS